MSAPLSTHVPVLLPETLDALQPRDGARYVDGTFGRGGYSRAILAAAAASVLGIDRDPEAEAEGRRLEQENPRFTMVEGRFGEMEQLVGDFRPLDGIALDLGVSSPQLDRAERGFSFREDGPLDMRMGASGRTAAEVVNETDEAELADIIFRLGEERRARAVARAIVAARPINRTLELAEVVRSVVRRAADRLDPATRTFQALRLYVNDELGELDRGLAAAERLLAPGGRLAVVSFHSLEDRLVKRFLAARATDRPQGSRHRPVVQGDQPTFRLLFRGAIKPGAEEIRLNPRAASARLRAAERTAADPAVQGAGAAA